MKIDYAYEKLVSTLTGSFAIYLIVIILSLPVWGGIIVRLFYMTFGYLSILVFVIFMFAGTFLIIGNLFTLLIIKRKLDKRKIKIVPIIFALIFFILFMMWVLPGISYHMLDALSNIPAFAPQTTASGNGVCAPGGYYYFTYIAFTSFLTRVIFIVGTACIFLFLYFYLREPTNKKLRRISKPLKIWAIFIGVCASNVPFILYLIISYSEIFHLYTTVTSTSFVGFEHNLIPAYIMVFVSALLLFLIYYIVSRTGFGKRKGEATIDALGAVGIIAGGLGLISWVWWSLFSSMLYIILILTIVVCIVVVLSKKSKNRIWNAKLRNIYMFLCCFLLFIIVNYVSYIWLSQEFTHILEDYGMRIYTFPFLSTILCPLAFLYIKRPTIYFESFKKLSKHKLWIRLEKYIDVFIIIVIIIIVVSSVSYLTFVYTSEKVIDGHYTPALALNTYKENGNYTVNIVAVSPSNIRLEDIDFYITYSYGNFISGLNTHGTVSDVDLTQCLFEEYTEILEGNVSFYKIRLDGYPHYLESGDYFVIKGENAGGVAKDGFRFGLTYKPTGGTMSIVVLNG